MRIVKYFIITLLLFIISVFFVSLTKDPNYNTRNLVGKKLPMVKLESFDEKKFLTNKDLKKENFTLINFWASWCGPCRDEHPILMKLNLVKNISLIGINFKDNDSKAKIFIKNFGDPYDFIAKDKLGKQSINFGIYGIPESILLRKDLTIIQKFVGPLTKEDYKEIIKIVKSK
mgnify:CR=1 FL=1